MVWREKERETGVAVTLPGVEAVKVGLTIKSNQQ